MPDPPFLSGWVVEIRGYTYYDDKDFVRDTLLENLQYPEKLKDLMKEPALKEQVEKIAGKVKYTAPLQTPRSAESGPREIRPHQQGFRARDSSSGGRRRRCAGC